MKTINKIFNILYCFGAAVVILGAWSKLLHKPGANLILTIGLLTEATLFVFMGIQEWTAKTEEKSVGGESVTVDTSELTGAVKETNNILRKIFKAE